MSDDVLADATEAALDADGLGRVSWSASDTWEPGALAASPQDARGRGMLLTVTRGGRALDLSSGATLYLVWRHRQTHARGCVAMEAVDAAAGEFRVFWPAAMASHEGSCECEVLLSWGERAIASPAFDVEVGTSLVGKLAVRDGFTLFVDAIKRYEDAAADALAVAAELRAATGADGRDGADATIADVTATVDASSGTPAVSVTLGGTPSARTLSFAFTGLKGERGATGATGATGERGADGATPDLSAYATKEWVSSQFPDLSGVSY